MKKYEAAIEQLRKQVEALTAVRTEPVSFTYRTAVVRVKRHVEPETKSPGFTLEMKASSGGWFPIHTCSCWDEAEKRAKEMHRAIANN
jgi:hypothetical protein